MLTLRFFIITLTCIAVVCVLYFLNLAPKAESVEDVFTRLQNNTAESILAFTYKRTADGFYENYTFDENSQLQKSLDPFALNYDGSEFKVDTNNAHGAVIPLPDGTGFSISGIVGDLQCPPNWEYVNDKCRVKEVCQPNDKNVYRGINFYYFGERLAGRQAKSGMSAESFHARQYYSCDAGRATLMNCAPNELYVGGKVLEANSGVSPCSPYDICSDRMEATVHKYQTSESSSLAPDEYYICNNGVSILRKCPVNTSFSTIANACVTTNRCLDSAPGTTFPTLDLSKGENSYVLCRNGRENTVNCSNGIFVSEKDNTFTCRNTECTGGRTILTKTLEYFRYPYAYGECPAGENTFKTYPCEQEEDYITCKFIPVSQGNLPYRQEQKLVEDFKIPNKSMDMSFTCVPFQKETFSRNNIVNASYNYGLQSFRFNVLEQRIDYDSFTNTVYKDGPVVKTTFDESTYSSVEYANFCELEANMFSNYELQSSVGRVVGDTDYVIYALLVNTTDFSMNRSPIDLASSVTMSPPQINTYFNAYTQTFTSLQEAHFEDGLESLPFNSSHMYSFFADKTSVQIENDATFVDLHVWSAYGMVRIRGKLQKYCLLTDDGDIVHETLPATKEVVQKFELPDSTSFRGIVTNVRHKEFSYDHFPICLQWLEDFVVLEPPGAVELSDKQSLFPVSRSQYYVLPAD
jgi:hypothetical protein